MAETGADYSVFGQQPVSEETLLLGHLRRVEANPAGFFAVHIHLSDLQPGNRQPKFIRIAAQAFDDLVNNFETTLYMMPNSDLALLSRETPIEDVDAALSKARALFSEDPLTEGDEGSFEDRFATWYDLSQASDFGAFEAEIVQISEAAEGARRRELEGRTSSAAHQMSGTPLTPRNLEVIAKAIEGMEIAEFIRHQPAVEVRSDAKGALLFNEYYISMADLKARVAPGINIFASPWLFNFLTEILDARLLAVMVRDILAAVPDPISLNLNISTVMGREYQNFHRNAGSHAERVVIELQMIDVLADVSMYEYARDMLRDHGYRVLIDGMNPLALQFLDPGMLEADFVKVAWGTEFLGDDSDDKIHEIRDVVENIGPNKVIVARAESEEAVVWALRLGIRRFQGHYVDDIVRAMYEKGIL